MSREPEKPDFTAHEKAILRAAGYDPAEVHSFEFSVTSGQGAVLKVRLAPDTQMVDVKIVTGVLKS